MMGSSTFRCRIFYTKYVAYMMYGLSYGSSPSRWMCFAAQKNTRARATTSSRRSGIESSRMNRVESSARQSSVVLDVRPGCLLLAEHFLVAVFLHAQ
eukprot:scaffold117881_cov38-Attheya_sp.AAC.1